WRLIMILRFVFLFFVLSVLGGEIETLPNTQPLTLDGDAASLMVDGIDRFLLKEIDKAAQRRDELWKKDDVAEKRKRLAHMLGVRDERVPFDAPQILSTTEQSG